MLDARQQIRDRFLSGLWRGAKNDLVGIFQPKRDDVTVFQRAAFDFFVVYKHPAPLPAIFYIESVRLDYDRCALPRNAPVIQLQVITGLRSAPHHVRRLCNTRVASRPIRRNHFEDRFRRP